MYCKKCGKQIEDDSEFCRYCGTLQLEKGADASAKKAVDDTQDIQGFFSEKEKEQRRKMVKSHEAATKKKKTIITVVVSIILSVAAISLILFGYILPNAHLQFKYELIEDEYYYITGYRGSDKNIIIPETIFGKPVTGIAGYAFKDNDNIRSVTFGENMAMIGASAFEDCGALSSVEFKDDPNNNPHYILWERAFANCTDLQSVRFAVSGYYSVLSGCFENCTSLSNINFESASFAHIEERAFNSCTSLSSLAFDPDHGIELGENAFANCTNILSVVIKSDIIPASCFDNCASLESFTGKDIKVIDEYAFSHCYKLKDVDLCDKTDIIIRTYHDSLSELADLATDQIIIAPNAFADCIYDPKPEPEPEPEPIITIPETDIYDYSGFDYAGMSFYDIDGLFDSKYEYWATKNHYMINDNASLSVYPYYDAVETYGIYLQGSGVTIDGTLTLGHDVGYYEDYFDLTLYDDLYMGAGEYGTTWQEFGVITTTWDGRQYHQTYRVTDDGTYTVYGVTIIRTE